MLKRNLARAVLGVAEREVRCLPPGTRGAECAGWCACGRGRVYAGAYECVQTQHMSMAHGLQTMRLSVPKATARGLRRLAKTNCPTPAPQHSGPHGSHSCPGCAQAPEQGTRMRAAFLPTLERCGQTTRHTGRRAR